MIDFNESAITPFKKTVRGLAHDGSTFTAGH